MIPWWVWLGTALAFLRPSGAKAEPDGDAKTPPDVWPDPPTPELPPSPQPPPVPVPGTSPLWPLPSSTRAWRASSFSSRRPWSGGPPQSHHKGIDIKAKRGDPVVVPETGKVIGKTGWVGDETAGVLFQTFGGPTLVFGAVEPGSFPDTGKVLERGEQIARIGRYPGGSSMLHLELYKVGTTKRVKWPWETPQPPTLVNPNSYLLATVNT